jgi:hypothetical protein
VNVLVASDVYSALGLLACSVVAVGCFQQCTSQQLYLLVGFVELKTELKDYLKKFADNGKVSHNNLCFICFVHTTAVLRPIARQQL